MSSGTGEDPFDVLGVGPEATPEQVVAAFRREAMASHPDRVPGDAARLRFEAATRARAILEDPVRRAEAAEAHFRRSRGPAKGFSGFDGFFDDIARNGRGADIRQARPARGPDARVEVTLTLEEAYGGGERKVEGRPGPCEPCDGTGRAETATPVRCESCQGRGRSRRGGGMITVEVRCPDCDGRGTVSHAPCAACAGTRQALGAGAPYAVPPGVEDGAEIRVGLLGGPGLNGGPPGDLVIGLAIAPHRVFARRGADLAMRLRVPVWDAAMGATCGFRGIDGERVEFPLPPGTPGGSRFRIDGAGMPDGRGRGRLLVTVEVEVPDASAGAMREAFERVRALSGQG